MDVDLSCFDCFDDFGNKRSSSDVMIAATRMGLTGEKEKKTMLGINYSLKGPQIEESWPIGEGIAKTALNTINGGRQDQYGAPENTFDLIGKFWGAYLGMAIAPEQVADMMALLKIARERGGKGKRDNAVDLIGYALLAAHLRGYDKDGACDDAE